MSDSYDYPWAAAGAAIEKAREDLRLQGRELPTHEGNDVECARIERLLQKKAFKGEHLEYEQTWRLSGVTIECRYESFWRVIGPEGFVYDNFEEDADAAWRKFFELVK